MGSAQAAVRNKTGFGDSVELDSPAPSFLPFPLCGTSYANAFSQVVDGTWLESVDSRKESPPNQSNRKENGKSSKSRGGWPISQRSSNPTDQLPNLLLTPLPKNARFLYHSMKR
ncbi:hypothetical protein Acr_00g0001730 [Actinidia rufa]|nr:hypothetical protein Acr_00g0001730 [Actinidia rufa]